MGFFFNEGNYTSAPQTTWGQSQLGSSIYNQNWEISMDQSDPFESALSSIVSSPVASSPMNGGGGENFMIRELIGRLGSICNSGEISPHSFIGGSTNTSRYNTPLNSPPKLNLSIADPQVRANFQFSGHHLPSHPNISPFSTDSGFAERAARFSCFNNTGSSNRQIVLNEAETAVRSISRVDSGKFSRVLGNRSKSGGQEGRGGKSILEKFNWFSTSSAAGNAEVGGSREGSTLTEQNPGGKLRVGIKGENNSRKRKSIPKGEAKESKRNIQNEASGNEKDASEVKAEPSGDIKEEEDGNQKQTQPSEPPKDYIHVRARRGQATDSHSLAERVRREKISQRMKFLQDLVPGCDKVTGKAVMLDEIITYVQSLQRQVEYLSMKLATISPRMDASMEGLLPPFSSGYQSLQLQTIHGGVSSGTELNLPMNNLGGGYGESSRQVAESWADDLQSVVQMGYDPNQQKHFHVYSPSKGRRALSSGSMAETQMEAEL